MSKFRPLRWTCISKHKVHNFTPITQQMIKRKVEIKMVWLIVLYIPLWLILISRFNQIKYFKFSLIFLLFSWKGLTRLLESCNDLYIETFQLPFNILKLKRKNVRIFLNTQIRFRAKIENWLFYIIIQIYYCFSRPACR